ncbi:MAG TPA: HTH domain-containing protein [Burkholderiales bacterium]|nr:HTH domain-containing protein [Burkholderiales bacterium]
MLDILGQRQKELLQLLLKSKSGLTVEELSTGLQITRNAVRQHLAALENDGLVALASTRPSGGRPQQLYALTDKGKEVFPRHYSWFAQLVIEAVRREHGPEGLRERLSDIGSAVAGQLRTQSPESTTCEQKVEKLAAVMDQLGYNARVTAAKEPTIEADNCVFHELAVKNQEICDFDLAMMGTFTGSKVDHQECMARGGNVCRFRFVPRK